MNNCNIHIQPVTCAEVGGGGGGGGCGGGGGWGGGWGGGVGVV